MRDGLALARALPDRSLVLMVAAMSLLASLTFACAVGAQSLSARWAKGAANLVTVQIPDPDKPAASGHAGALSRLQAVLTALQANSSVVKAHRLDDKELDTLLKPWIGDTSTAAIPLPAVIEVDLAPDAALPDTLISDLVAKAPGTLVEKNDDWRGQLHAIASSLVACAGLALLLVGAIGAAVIGMATRLGLSARRESVTILHELGASDGYVARRFGGRIALLSFAGGVAGTALSIPPIAFLARLMAPLAGAGVDESSPGALRDWWGFCSRALGTLLHGDAPQSLLIGLACVPLAVTLIGWLTAQVIVRVWLRRLP